MLVISQDGTAVVPVDKYPLYIDRFLGGYVIKAIISKDTYVVLGTYETKDIAKYILNDATLKTPVVDIYVLPKMDRAKELYEEHIERLNETKETRED